MLLTMIDNGTTSRSHATVQVPPWDLLDNPTGNPPLPFRGSATSFNFNGNAVTSPNGDSNFSAHIDSLTSLRRFLSSNTAPNLVGGASGEFDHDGGDEFDIPVDEFSSDHFRMYEFKVRKCARGRSHDWTDCPFAHPGEKARRRDPTKHYYSGMVCSEFRKGLCRRGEACELAHGVFECWLHPSRYRTQPCKDGTHCRRQVCFFAHTPRQLRVLPQGSPRMSESYDGSPSRLALETLNSSCGYSPPMSPRSESSPISPSGSLRLNSVSNLAASVRNMHISKVRMSMSPPFQMGSGFSSPRSSSTLGSGFYSLPCTPTRARTGSGYRVLDLGDPSNDEERTMERVESGKELRAQIYARLSKQNSIDQVDSVVPGPDVEWISELLK